MARAQSVVPWRIGCLGLHGSGGRGWTERSEGSPGVSGWHPPTPATHQSIADSALRHGVSQSFSNWSDVGVDALEIFLVERVFVVLIAS